MRLLILFSAVFCLTAAGAPINLNTGQSPGTIGTFSDPIWSIAASPSGIGMNNSGPAYIEHNAYPSSSGLLWSTAGLPPSTVANFISSGDCGRVAYTADCPVGTYSFTTPFTVTDLPSAVLEFSVAGDNIVQVYLNNALLYAQGSVSGSAGWAAMSPLQTVTSGFVLGVNTLELRVINDSVYTGGILTGSFNQTPEPATLAFTGAGLMLLAVLRRRQ